MIDPVTATIVGAHIVAIGGALISELRKGRNPFWEFPKKGSGEARQEPKPRPRNETRFQKIVNE